MIDIEIQQALEQALRKAQACGDLPPFELPREIPVERPRQSALGDFATPICMQLARTVRLAPMQIAEMVSRHLPKLECVSHVEIASPGFINFRLSLAWLTSQVEVIRSASETYGRIDLGRGRKVQVEFVSANPTGPLHIGSARNAALGDALASILETVGYEVQREYYVNDAGHQVRVFGETLYARYAQALGREETVPEDGYQGLYLIRMGAELAAKVGDKYLRMPREEAVQELGEWGVKEIIKGAREDLALMGVRFDNWFSERSLYVNGQYERVMAILRERGYLDYHDGAIWFKAQELGGEKDEVLVRSDGSPGYFASDIAYHYNKFVERGFDWVIDVWGADHQGHVPRMKAMMKALGLDPNRLTLILYQLVTLKRSGEVVRLSKRTGDIITLREVLEEVGPDAMRFFLLSRSADSQMDFDIDLAKEQSDENPVYYVQYAHARISSILRFAGELDYSDGDVSLLTSEPELNLIRQMTRFPEVVRTAAVTLSPHHLTYYAQDLATAFHSFYRDCRVVSLSPEDMAITKARLKLVSACKIVLARTLHLLGMTAPEMM